MTNRDDLDFTDPYEIRDEEEDDDEQYWNPFWNDDLPIDPQEQIGCILGDVCIMPGLHYPNECHTIEDLEAEWTEEKLPMTKTEVGRDLYQLYTTPILEDEDLPF